MRIKVSGKQIDIGDALRGHAEETLGNVLGKYAGRPTDSILTFSRVGHAFSCEASVHLSTGLSAQAHGQGKDIYSSLEDCAEKLETQMRRYKRRLKNHHQARTSPVEFYDAPSYILAASDEDEGSDDTGLQPVIVAETETKIRSLTVGEAVMQMELAGAPILVFRKDGEDRVNVVYRREDGNIGWIDPRPAEQV